jgi:hypothetical protein
MASAFGLEPHHIFKLFPFPRRIYAPFSLFAGEVYNLVIPYTGISSSPMVRRKIAP